MRSAATAKQPVDDVDAELIADQLVMKLNEERSIESQIKNLEGKLDELRERRRARRLEIGNLLISARRLWPSPKQAQGGARGPGGKTWEQFLQSVRLNDTTAWRYMCEVEDGVRPGARRGESPRPQQLADRQPGIAAPAEHVDGQHFDPMAELAKWRRWASELLGSDGFQGDEEQRAALAARLEGGR